MEEIRAENLPIVREEAGDKDEALAKIRGDRAKSRFKQELISGFPAHETVSFYPQGEFMDLCRGPHLPSTGRVAAFKLLSVAGAYWRGDEKRDQLQRIYATAFFDKDELKQFVHRRRRRRKRITASSGNSFSSSRCCPRAPGFPLLAAQRHDRLHTLVDYMREKLPRTRLRRDPHAAHPVRRAVKRSGHWAHYRENMYLTEIEEKEFAIKPMSCRGAPRVQPGAAQLPGAPAPTRRVRARPPLRGERHRCTA